VEIAAFRHNFVSGFGDCGKIATDGLVSRMAHEVVRHSAYLFAVVDAWVAADFVGARQ
jgi:hypothetical protein